LAILKKLIMIKRTLHFGNPAYLSTKNEQLVIQYPDDPKPSATVPIEDIGIVVLEHPQLTITNALLDKLNLAGVAVLHCNAQHLPVGLLMPLNGHTEQNERIRKQLDASLPLKKNLWQQTIKQKILNQAALLQQKNVSIKNMLHWAKEVSSGDAMNHEARAAAYYWQNLFYPRTFFRQQQGDSPNNMLNYGYAILRAITARALVSSGMLPVIGIHHANKYNAYCLADDIMEPYRPMVDALVCELTELHGFEKELTTTLKKELLKIPVLDVKMNGQMSPLMIAMSRTTASLYDCFAGDSRKILYPEHAFN